MRKKIMTRKSVEKFTQYLEIWTYIFANSHFELLASSLRCGECVSVSVITCPQNRVIRGGLKKLFKLNKAKQELISFTASYFTRKILQWKRYMRQNIMWIARFVALTQQYWNTYLSWKMLLLIGDKNYWYRIFKTLTILEIFAIKTSP